MLNKTLISLLLCVGILWSPVQAAEKVTYIHNDALGSPVAATDANGKLLWREDYKPYGERIRKETAAKGNTLWYTGKPHEENFGLSYFGARWYSPQMGRFTGIDPAGFSEGNVQSFNRYAYANNNPYRYVDPDGRDAIGIVFKGYEVNTGFGFTLPLGHAGVVLIDNKTGVTKYYDYGRYNPNNQFVIGEKLPDKQGNIRNIPISNAVMGKDGKPTPDSLKAIYKSLSKVAGENKPVDADYREGADFSKMDTYVKKLAKNRKRDKYSLPSNTCYTFKNKVLSAGK